MSKTEVKKKDRPEGFTLGLALLDLLPVIFFTISTIKLGSKLGSGLFVLGSIICFLAGLLKVVWKILIVLKNKDIRLLNRQMRYLMPSGFLLMIIGIILNLKKINGSEIVKMILASPFKFLIIVPVILMIIMLILAFKGDGNDGKTNWIEEIINSLAQLMFMLAVIYFTFIGSYYRPTEAALASLENLPAGISLEKSDSFLAFVPESANKGIVFYPGGNVDYRSYAPLMRDCAENGVLCVIMKMPDNMAIFNVAAADGVQSLFPQIEEWYMAGHSLGGAMAGSYVAKHSEDYKGLILLASYSQKDLRGLGLKVASIHGSEDKVLNKEKYEANSVNLPEDHIELEIEGGCHAYFGNYGPQAGDGSPSIDEDAQQKATIEAILQLIAS